MPVPAITPTTSPSKLTFHPLPKPKPQSKINASKAQKSQHEIPHTVPQSNALPRATFNLSGNIKRKLIIDSVVPIIRPTVICLTNHHERVNHKIWLTCGELYAREDTELVKKRAMKLDMIMMARKAIKLRVI